MSEQIIHQKIERTSIAVPRSIFAILKYVSTKNGTSLTQLALRYMTAGLIQDPMVSKNKEFNKELKQYVFQQKKEQSGIVSAEE